MEKSAYRILDANFNRAGEGLRVMEEYCRFVLSNFTYSQRAKKLRHDLANLRKKFDYERLICARDSINDVGRERPADNQMARDDMKGCFLAASRRICQALRSIGEVSNLIRTDISNEFERLRFEVYTLEKDVCLFSSASKRYGKVALYVIITVNDQLRTENLSDLIKMIISGGADCIQIRGKSVSDKKLLKMLQMAAQQCTKAEILFIVNDRVDLAVVSGADGVHLGQEEIAVSYAQKIADRPMLYGVSTHNLEELERAINQGAHYVGLGTVYKSPTKPEYKVSGLDYIKKAVNRLENEGIGHAAIGGINFENAEEVLKAGAKTLAVSSAVTSAENPEVECKKLKKLIEMHR
jgi:thiamine-phosphate pyrophosphorylase